MGFNESPPLLVRALTPYKQYLEKVGVRQGQWWKNSRVDLR